MDMNKIGGNIIKAFAILGAIVGIIGSLYLGMFLITLVLGVIFGTVTSGDITVDGNTSITLAAVQRNFSSAVGDVTTGTSIAGSLIPVAIVLLVFAGIVVLGYTGYKSYKGGSGGQSGGY